MSSAGRPLSGVVRPETHARPGTMEQTLRTSRTSRTARATSSSSARFVRLGTASMISQPDGPFVNLSRLNVDKYATDPQVNRTIFEYIAAIATKKADYIDWYWKNQVGKCYYRLGMFSDALKQFHSSLNNQKVVETYGYLAKVEIITTSAATVQAAFVLNHESIFIYHIIIMQTYNRIDQPLMATDQYNFGLQIFQNDITLLIGLARVQEVIIHSFVKYL
ncbi:unnamed protein product [Gongylonema pulchrum]|uniref:TPR_REGION domain-containing protein n=1 Tax=Gongylonema pulchrum TaxID=637853 RepID=A0A183E126_9BILA|nr:unnamed protein product [Gongylonema pulchrum]